jgi:dTDP-4-dehydrorhamnose reductase
VAIKELSESACEVKAIRTIDYPTPAARPAYSAFDTSRIREVYGLSIPTWKESLAIMLQQK